MKQLILIVILIVVAWMLFAPEVPLPPAANVAEILPAAPASILAPAAAAPRFFCDGRETCSQMNSREEANFFVRNCPSTRMDGDNDGDACENDTRF